MANTTDYKKRSRGSFGETAVPGAVIGRNAVRELLKSGRDVEKIFCKRGEREGSITELLAAAKSRGIPTVEVEVQKLDAMSGGANHQGIIAMASACEYGTLDDIFENASKSGTPPLIAIADGVTDPQNLGALIRCVDCSGAHGLIIPKRRSAGVTPAVTKSSAGAVEHVTIVRATNLADTVSELQRRGVWVFAAEAGGKPYYECDFTSPTAIIFGSEGSGVQRLLREKSDFIVSIPMYGKINSLNVSCAAAVLLTEAARQMREKIEAEL